MPKGHDSSSCNCNFCRAKRGEQYGQDNPNKGGYKITDTTKYKIAARKRIPELRKEMIEKNKKRWSNPENKKKHIKRLIGNAYVLGKTWKVKDPSKMGRYKGCRSSMLGKKHTKEAIQKMREYAIDNSNRKFSDTSIELKVEEELKKRLIEYKKNIVIENIARVDFYLPDSNVIIFCDGCYWHNCPECYPNGTGARKIRKDKTKFKEDFYKKYGFDCLSLWTHEINSKDNIWKDKLRSFIQ